MKLTKVRNDEDWGSWKPVKLTRACRHEIFKALESGAKQVADFDGQVPLPQLMAITREFTNFKPKAKVPTKPTGIIGDNWFCEAGCGAVMKTKPSRHVFLRKKPNTRFFCEACFAEFKRLHPDAPLVDGAEVKPQE